MDKADQFYFFSYQKISNISWSPIKYSPGRFEKTSLFSHAEVVCCKQYEKSTWFNQTDVPFCQQIDYVTQEQGGSFTVPAGRPSHFWSLEMTNRLRSTRTCKTIKGECIGGQRAKSLNGCSQFRQITTESILWICRHCSDPPAPANTSQLIGL